MSFRNKADSKDKVNTPIRLKSWIAGFIPTFSRERMLNTVGFSEILFLVIYYLNLPFFKKAGEGSVKAGPSTFFQCQVCLASYSYIGVKIPRFCLFHHENPCCKLNLK
jgi:hypothetical protein